MTNELPIIDITPVDVDTKTADDFNTTATNLPVPLNDVHSLNDEPFDDVQSTAKSLFNIAKDSVNVWNTEILKTEQTLHQLRVDYSHEAPRQAIADICVYANYVMNNKADTITVFGQDKWDAAEPRKNSSEWQQPIRMLLQSSVVVDNALIGSAKDKGDTKTKQRDSDMLCTYALFAEYYSVGLNDQTHTKDTIVAELKAKSISRLKKKIRDQKKLVKKPPPANGSSSDTSKQVITQSKKQLTFRL